MSLSDDLIDEVAEIFKTQWSERAGQKVPEPEDVSLGNEAVTLHGTVLYADLADSTGLVQNHERWFAAEVYKAYLLCASKIIRDEGGVITAFDGDRVMGVFIGDLKNTCAARCALKINHAVVNIINPSVQKQFKDVTYKIQQAVGIDTGPLFVARTGVRGANDLVWVGRAANYAAKMCSLREGYFASWITKDVYDKLGESAKFYNGQNMWESCHWSARNIAVYRSSWTWSP